ncbi:MAG: ABC transporter ATP-binding protein [Desulfomonilaceae bacterium]|nr:ABC transporter ATP-binding protein [Desulfomonilaceae bacterium]
MLDVKNIDVYYGQTRVLEQVSLHVAAGEIVALLGPNAAGKTTALKTFQGLIRPASGEVRYMGRNVHRVPPHRLPAEGLSLVPEERMLFLRMTCRENLELGAYNPNARKVLHSSLRWVYELFPRLRERESQKVADMSGGEQQMVAIGRALMSQPRLLMLDEPSLGLAPIVVAELFRTIREINENGISVLLVEQSVKQSLELARHAYVLESGKIVKEGTAKDLADDPDVRAAYLGM